MEEEKQPKCDGGELKFTWEPMIKLQQNIIIYENKLFENTNKNS